MEVKLSIEDNQFDFFMKFLEKLQKGILIVKIYKNLNNLSEELRDA